MNAPWRPGGPRDMFQAFMCDDASISILRSIVIEMGWEAERVYKGGMRNAVQALSVSASPHILFIDLSETPDPLAEINNLAEVCEPGTIVIAAGHINDVRLFRDLQASGIQDYLLKPLNVDHVRDALTQAQATFMAPRSDQSAERNHMSVAVIGTRGGCGASTLAASLGWILSNDLQRSTALLDLDLHFGTLALTLDIEPGRGLIDAIDNPSRIDGLFLERAMIRANEHLAILSAEAPLNQQIVTDGGAFFQLEDEFRQAFDSSVIDLPRSMLVQHPQLMAETALAVLVTEMTLSAARDTIRLLAWLKANAPGTRVLIVANKFQANALEISQKDFEQSIETKIDVVIPYDARMSAQAAKLGKPLAEVSKGGKTGQALADMAHKLLDMVDDGDGAAKPQGGGSLLSKLVDLKGLLPRRKAAEAKAEAVG